MPGAWRLQGCHVGGATVGFTLLLLMTGLGMYELMLRWPQSIAGVAMDTYHRWMEIVAPFTLAGLPVSTEAKFLSQQVVLVGYGRVGRRIAEALA